MAGFRTVPHGKVEQLISKLAEAGFDESLIDFVNSKPELAREWEKSLRGALNPPAPTFDQLFRSTPEVLEAFLVRSKQCGWGFGDEHIDALRKQPIELTSSLNQVLSLEIWLGDLPTTFEQLWSWNQDVHAKTWRYDGLKSGKKQLRLLDPKRYGTQPSVKWVVLDVTANRGQAPKDVRDPATSPALAVLAAAALHPDWPPAINYDTIPGVWLPGLQATVPGDEPWRYVPVLRWDGFDRGVRLGADWDDYRGSRYAVPVSREL